MPNLPVALGEIFAGKYRLERILGEGGMGVVVAAHHLELDQPVAVKFLLEAVAENEEGGERFRREARAAAKIQSDHVVRVLDVGMLDDGVRYMVMEYLDGSDLCEELANQESFPIGAACGFVLEALDAVGHAHQHGIVHRDLKPANLFLAKRPDGARRIKVLDFGISKSVGATTSEQLSLTKTSAWIGSPLYMAPEQMQSARDVDTRADIWSLGAILYELIVGNPPYQADSLPQLCNLLMTTDPPDIKEHCPTIPDDLAVAIMSCLVRDVDARTQTCAEFARGISRHATTVTGSGMSHSLLARTEFSAEATSSLPGSQLAAPSTQGAGSASGFISPETAASSTTHSNWGGTDAGEKKGAGKWPFIAAAIVVAGLGGFFLASPSGAESEPEEEVVVVGAADPGSELSPDSEAEVEPATPEIDEEEESTDDKGEEKSDEEPSAAPAPSAAPTPKPVTSSQPKPRVKAAPRPRPAAEPKTEPAPSAEPKDDFADFGGRR